MTQKEKAQRYDEAIEIARKINSGEGVEAPPDWTIPEVIFPELRESKDDESQGTPIINKCREHKFEKGDFIVNNSRDVYQITEIRDDEYCLWPLDAEIMGYLRIIDVDNEYHFWTIDDAKKGDVLFCNGDIKGSNGIKYGKICLFNNLNNAFFTLTKTYNSVEEYAINVNIDYPYNTVPATKEQKEILFMVMKDAGYKFDTKKKELKKINQKSYGQRKECLDCQFNYAGECKGSCAMKRNEQKTFLQKCFNAEYERGKNDAVTWSEEDEKCTRLSTDIIDSALRAGFCVQLDRDRCIDWIKSLKDRVQPKQELNENS